MTEQAVAIVGLAVRVPGAETPEELWKQLVTGQVALPAARRGAAGRLRMGEVDRVAEFDIDLFGVTPLQARVADPQHRALLELSWLAIEDAGLVPSLGEEAVGVFVGCGPQNYERHHLSSDPDLLSAAGAQQVALLNDRDFLASTISYKLGLTGPSITVQTACSTSLVAVHLAARSLLTYETDAALAGAATLQLSPNASYEYRDGDILSPDGRCRAFTSGSCGTVPSSGGAIVVLKRLEDALAAGDPVRAVIIGSAVNNDGSARMSQAAPSPEGHERVIREALAVAGVAPESVAFVQTHGTGTSLGDQVELAALRATYGQGAGVPAALGAVKVNLGHTDTAAGVVGLAAAVLALDNAVIPPVPQQPGDGADVALHGRLILPRETRPWPQTGDVRRAAVSSLGLGGTNAHVVLEAAPAEMATTSAPWVSPQIAPISAATEEALRERAFAIAGALRKQGLSDLCATLWHRRRHLPARLAPVLTATDETSAIQQLEEALRDASRLGSRRQPDGPVVALLPGQGEGVTRAARALLTRNGRFRAHFDELVELIRAVGGVDLTAVGAQDAMSPPVIDTAVVQPWLFVLESALLRTLEDAGVNFAALAGHSVGELVAAAHAGVFSPEDAALAVVERGRLMASMPGGAMVAVELDEASAHEVADGLDVALAAVNDAYAAVLAGSVDALAEVEIRVARRGKRTKRLAVSHAFHSRMMDKAADGFAKTLATMPLSAPRIPVLSNVTGRLLTSEQAMSATYWAHQLRGTVRFHACLTALLDLAPAFVLEAGPGDALSGIARRVARRNEVATTVLPVLGADVAHELTAYQRTLAALWESGRNVDLDLPRPSVIATLPPYPFARTRYWAGPGAKPQEDQRSEVVPEVAVAVPGGTGSATADILADLWRRSFGGPPIRPDDNFFEMGGSSLQAAQLVNEVAEAVVLDLGLNDLYEHSTFADFVEHVTALIVQRDESPEFAALLADLTADGEVV